MNCYLLNNNTYLLLRLFVWVLLCHGLVRFAESPTRGLVRFAESPTGGLVRFAESLTGGLVRFAEEPDAGGSRCQGR
eukprot:863284-Prorocentrum_minimum.AAC.2